MRAIVLSLFGLLISCGTLSSTAQTVPSSASPLAACGDNKTLFDVTPGAAGSQSSPAPGKATVYIVELLSLGDKGLGKRPIIRQGLDGTWIGATQGFSYVSASIDPGAHHLCSRWQGNGKLSQQISLNNFDAVAGMTYFYRLQINFEGESGVPVIDLQPVAADEGVFLLSEAAQSLSKPKK